MKNVNGNEIYEMSPKVVVVKFDELGGWLVGYKTSKDSNQLNIIANYGNEQKAKKVGLEMSNAFNAKLELVVRS